MTLRLRVDTADGRSFEQEVSGDALVVGRSSRAGLVLPDPVVSREHARLFREGDAWVVQDLGSHFGTRVNGEQITAARRLAHGDSIGLGGSTLVVDLGLLSAPPGTEDSTIYRSAQEVLTGSLGVVGSDGTGEHRTGERLRVLMEVNQALAGSISLEELLDLVLDRAFELLRPQEAAIFLRDAAGNDFCAARRSTSERASRPMHSRSLLHEVIDKGMAAQVVDAASDERFAESKSLLVSGLRSLLAAPLLDPQGALGMIVVGASLGVRSFGTEDLELLVALAAVASMRIRNVRLVLEAMERQKLEQELRLARQIQVALLPSKPPEVPGIELFGRNLPSRAVSGDFYTLAVRKDGAECVVFVADVSGKGIAASLLTASLEALSAVPLATGEAPDKVFETVAGLLFDRTPPERFATAFLAVLEVASGSLSFVNAGHTAAILLRASGEPVLLKSNGVPLGLLPDAKYRAGVAALEPGDSLMVYSDGLTEATDPDGEEFGVTRLVEAFQRHRILPLSELARAIEFDLDTFVRGTPFDDDRTLVQVRRTSRPLSHPASRA
ncbi:MAG TPA: SpoIIE family protein phosphatase [Thermoanaerobaculia bacterium]|nr:SpoIIE family protein phosphatase [Thermoanaerobaculia bacterium]